MSKGNRNRPAPRPDVEVVERVQLGDDGQPDEGTRSVEIRDSADAGPAPIKVRELRFRQGVPLTNSSLIARENANGIVTTIEYEPWQRHHRVREIENGRARNEYCVPESWCMYFPAAED